MPSFRDGKQLSYRAFLNGTLTAADAMGLVARTLIAHAVDNRNDVEVYEDCARRFIGVPHAFAVGAGRMGLYLLLRAYGFGAGDEIILPGYTCVVMPNAIRFAGCRPVYVDIRMSDFNVDPDLIEAAITPRTRAILLQHTFGIPADIAAVRAICDRRGLVMIEDGAHALGARYGGKCVGQWGDAAVFSTESSKMISTDKGGLIATTDSQLAGRLRELCGSLPIRPFTVEKTACLRVMYNVVADLPPSYRIRKLVGRAINRLTRTVSNGECSSVWQYDANEYQAELDGRRFDQYPRRLAGALARLGRIQINRLAVDVARRNEKAAYLAQTLPRFGAVVPDYDRSMSVPSFVKYPFLVEDRERWRAGLAALGLPTNTWLNDPLHPRETRCHEMNGYRRGACPNAEFVSSHVLNLPVGRLATLRILRRVEDLNL